MGCDCCGQQAPSPEPVAAPIATPTEKMNSCQDSCCDGNDLEEDLDTNDLGQEERTQENPDDCCSSGKCANDKPEHDPDTPDCCRGKVGPCCDTSCLDRLAMRECEMSAAAASGPYAQIKSE
jgi:Cu2+-exporting ATPase